MQTSLTNNNKKIYSSQYFTHRGRNDHLHPAGGRMVFLLRSAGLAVTLYMDESQLADFYSGLVYVIRQDHSKTAF